MIQQLYAVERKARQLMLDATEIKELRLTESIPVINELGKWIFEQIKSTLPRGGRQKARLERQCSTVMPAGTRSAHIYMMESADR